MKGARCTGWNGWITPGGWFGETEFGATKPGWTCAVTIAVTSAASVKITSAVMSSAAADCQLLASPLLAPTTPGGGTIWPSGGPYPKGEGPIGRAAGRAHKAAEGRGAQGCAL